MTNLKSSHATKQILASYAAIIFGGFGLHKFILGYKSEGCIMLIIAVIGGALTYGFALIIMQLIALIEAMIYLNKSSEDFSNTYFVKKQGWF